VGAERHGSVYCGTKVSLRCVINTRLFTSFMAFVRRRALEALALEATPISYGVGARLHPTLRVCSEGTRKKSSHHQKDGGGKKSRGPHSLVLTPTTQDYARHLFFLVFNVLSNDSSLYRSRSDNPTTPTYTLICPSPATPASAMTTSRRYHLPFIAPAIVCIASNTCAPRCSLLNNMCI
jgi:hypothetical protein